jgi:hypothetical protein
MSDGRTWMKIGLALSAVSLIGKFTKSEIFLSESDFSARAGESRLGTVPRGSTLFRWAM